MAWKKANKELIRLLEVETAKYPCDRKVMFGSPTFFLNNNMFAGVHEDTVILKLTDVDREELFATYPGVGLFEPMKGRPMKDFAALPEHLAQKAEVFQEWLARSYQYASSLPPKEKKRPRKKPPRN